MLLRKCLLLVALVASIAFSQTTSAALLTYTNLADYQAQLIASGIAETNFTNFDSLVPLARGMGSGTNFETAGIAFVGQNSLPLAPFSTSTESGATNSGLNFLGADFTNGTDFFGGDSFTIALQGASRAVRLNISTPNLIDSVNLATLTVGGTSISTLDANKTPISGGTNGYFLGIIDTTSSFSLASVSFLGAPLFRADDVGLVSVTGIPEPSSFALAAVAGLFTFTRRRRVR